MSFQAKLKLFKDYFKLLFFFFKKSLAMKYQLAIAYHWETSFKQNEGNSNHFPLEMRMWSTLNWVKVDGV